MERRCPQKIYKRRERLMAMKDLIGKIVGLDTMLFIYHIEDNPK